MSNSLPPQELNIPGRVVVTHKKSLVHLNMANDFISILCHYPCLMCTGPVPIKRIAAFHCAKNLSRLIVNFFVFFVSHFFQNLINIHCSLFIISFNFPYQNFLLILWSQPTIRSSRPTEFYFDNTQQTVLILISSFRGVRIWEFHNPNTIQFHYRSIMIGSIIICMISS